MNFPKTCAPACFSQLLILLTTAVVDSNLVFVLWSKSGKKKQVRIYNWNLVFVMGRFSWKLRWEGNEESLSIVEFLGCGCSSSSSGGSSVAGIV